MLYADTNNIYITRYLRQYADISKLSMPGIFVLKKIKNKK